MPLLPKWLHSYRFLPRSLVCFALGQFLINLINTAQFLLLNLFLKENGMDDPAIAALSSKRFLATFLLAVPAGLWLRGRPLRRPLIVSGILFPLAALGGLEAARMGWIGWAGASFVAMGFAGLVLHVASLPMSMRLAPPERVSEALSLLFSTWAAAAICGGALASFLQWLGVVSLGPLQITFDVHATLLILTLAGFGASWFFWKLPDAPPRGPKMRAWSVPAQDRKLLARVLVPSVCIAVGAGLSIQFLNLFFSHVHGMSPATYAMIGTLGSVLVLFAGLMVPEVKRRFGWKGAILGVQSLAVVMLLLLGFTEIWSAAAWALPLAVTLFVLRQPLMSMAGPATSELTLAYAGPRNHELVSACQGAIWSGSWWVAALIFQAMRAQDVPYWVIFTATAVLYAIGTGAYLGLIRHVEQQGSGEAGLKSAEAGDRDHQDREQQGEIGKNTEQIE